VSALNTAAALISLAALFSWINHRYIRLPTTIALLLFSLGAALASIGRGTRGNHFDRVGKERLVGVEFGQAGLHGRLSFRLVAGALRVDLGERGAR
jgi:CPA1 family monovalent cation:H+ antiporter